jgi:hypothetical protein
MLFDIMSCCFPENEYKFVLKDILMLLESDRMKLEEVFTDATVWNIVFAIS